MVIILFAVMLFLGLAFFQAVQGTYSAAIMAVLTTICAALAFSYYRPLAEVTLMGYQPGYAQGAALAVLFAVPLLAMRMLSDRFLGANVVLGALVDRVGGAVLGLYISAMVLGVFMTALQMLPWGNSILGYRPYDDKLQRNHRVYMDEFAVGVANVLSAGSLAASPPKPFASDHDNLLLELYCAHNGGSGGPDGAQPLEGQVEATAEGVSAAGAWTPYSLSNLPRWQSDTPNDPLLTANQNAQTRIVIVRYLLHDQTGKSETRLADIDGILRLAGTQFRLVTTGGRSVYPVAYLTYEPDYPARGDSAAWMLEPAPVSERGDVLIGRLAVVRPLGQPANPGKEPAKGAEKILIAVDWVYRLGEKDVPRYFVFRNVATGHVPAVQEGMPSGDLALGRKAAR